jgi:WhiB family redox-sensing transcriptional regulator
MTQRRPFIDVALPMGPEVFSFDSAWRDEAACRTRNDVDPKWWFPDSGRGRYPSLALKVCATCPVRKECLEYAIAAPERHGIWGGMMEQERRKEIRRREREAAQPSGWRRPI